MIDIIFGIVIIALIAFHAYHLHETNKEKAKLVNALIAKNPEQLRDLTLADKVQIKAPKAETPPDIVPMDSLSEEDFEKHIQDQLK